MFEVAIRENAKEHHVHDAENDPELQPLSLGSFFADLAALNDVGPAATEHGE